MLPRYASHSFIIRYITCSCIPAQRIGLEARTTSDKLSEDDWLEAKRKSNDRHDSRLPCVICKQNFGPDKQVISNTYR